MRARSLLSASNSVAQALKPGHFDDFFCCCASHAQDRREHSRNLWRLLSLLVSNASIGPALPIMIGCLFAHMSHSDGFAGLRLLLKFEGKSRFLIIAINTEWNTLRYVTVRTRREKERKRRGMARRIKHTIVKQTNILRKTKKQVVGGVGILLEITPPSPADIIGITQCI